MSDDKSWQQAQELAQSGKEGKTFGQAQDELLAKITDQTKAVSNALYALFVKKTADELPDCYTDVLLWYNNQWNEAWYDGNWTINEVSYFLEDGQYWLPMPSFNPESEG